MRKEGRMQNVLIVLLVVTIVGMSIGFAAAAFNQTLTINGDVTAKKAVWDIHWDNLVTKTGEGFVTATSAANEGDSYGTGSITNASTGTSGNTTNVVVNYTTVLAPGEKWGFTVDAKNFGTLEGKLVGVTVTENPATSTVEYLTHTVKVNNTTMNVGSNTVNTTIAEGEKDVVDVEVDYILPTDASKLPTEDKEFTFTVTLTYESIL